MKIYVVVGLRDEEMENVLVTVNEEELAALKAGDFECDALFVETWEDGGKIDEYRHTAPE
ncbi:hypothetical protein MO973_11025 [Paenibacillus sp. TRM 82003]|nr:hypothetical protein [Paenibacillus sp. TRM 82003]